MDDKSIRKILISYIQANSREVRIYQEKSIGASVCDVMAVTDCLTGYEIKSDLDNYARLPEQIKAYNLFFDRNYIVVSERHAASVTGKVPEHWGIVCIQKDDVSVTRVAKKNPNVSRRKQLSVLWKLELKNLLIKNSMPTYAQKEKGYIADRISERVESEVLGRQIAEELIQRDYSIYDASDYTIYSKREDFPAEEIVDTLSEKDLTDFTLDQWIELYKQAVSIREQKEALFEKPVKERIAHEIPYTEIEVSLGVPWVEVNIIEEFLSYLLGSPVGSYVKYEPITGCWHIANKQYVEPWRANATVKYGIERYNVFYILEATLNLREIKLYDYGNIYNERDTLAALEKQKLIRAEFKEWIWKDEDRRWQVEEAYNRMFSKYQVQEYDGSKLQFPDMNSEITLFPYQKDAVQKILQSKNTLLAFDVGAGKTYIMIAAAMNMRKEGISRKNMFVVPNHIVGQWENIFSQLYPSAKILAIEPKTYKPEMRSKVLTQIKEGDYDGIIIAYSCFEMIPLSVNSVLNNMNEQLRRIEQAVASLTNSYGYVQWGGVPLRQERQYIQKLTEDFLSSMQPTGLKDITFDDLEINTLFVDEAHNYKNIPIRTKMKNLNGINTKGSTKCLDLLHKVRHVQQSNGGRGVVFATGTPLCNSISDAYAMQMYLQYDELVNCKLDVFDNWVKTFALPEQLCEIDVDTSKFRVIRKFAKFFNLPELSRMFSQVAIFHAVNNKEDLPEFEGYTDVVIEKYQELTDYMRKLCERTEAIRSGMVERKYDNMLKISTDGRKAALDLKLVGEEQPYNQSSKVYNCVKNVSELYRKYPQTTQLIFCDYSTPKGSDFSVYKELKERLCEAGIPQKEIAFIHHYQTESRKVELFRKFNAGEMRILIGSTFKLGIGANVQVKLKAIHHLDVPWRPADMVQREGRIIRRGNENEDVLIYRYITEGSFDSYSWQILETKQKFISQFLAGSSYQRSTSDLENNVLTYAEVKALALSEPLMKQLAEKENEIKNLRIIIAKEEEVKGKLQEDIKELERKLPILSNRYYHTLENAKHLERYGEKAFSEAYHQISALLTEDVIFQSEPMENVIVRGFRIVLPEEQNKDKPYIFLERREERYVVEVGFSAEGNARRIINMMKKFDTVVEKTLQEYYAVAQEKKEKEQGLLLGSEKYIHMLRQYEEEANEIRERIQG